MENTAVGSYDNLMTAPYYVSPVELLGRLFPPEAGGKTKQTYNSLTKEIRKITDAKGNCQKDLNKFTDKVLDQVRLREITQSDADVLLSLFASLCTVQLSGTGRTPAAPVNAAGVRRLDGDPAPACSVSFTNDSPVLNFLRPGDPVTQLSFSRTGFTFAALWVGVDGGGSPAVGLDPANATGSGIDWSSEFVRLLMYLAGITSVSEAQTVNLNVAFGAAGTGDVYDGDAVVCEAELSVLVGELPVTGSNISGIVNTAIWVSLAGVLLAAAGVRRRRTRGVAV